jgi:MFS family permease
LLNKYIQVFSDPMEKSKMYTPSFILLCASGLLFFSSFNMIIPELPNYLRKLGGEEYLGLIIALFTCSAGLSRPFSGKLTDRVGRIPVMVLGAIVSGIASLIYPFVSSVFAFFLLRFFHGFSTGFKPTGTAAYIADIVPPSMRGEAMGAIGFFSSIGVAMGPKIGSYIASEYSIDYMFYIASTLSFLSVAILFQMKETLQKREKFKFKLLKISKKEIYLKDVFPAAIVMMFSIFVFGVILTIIPDFTIDLGMSEASKGDYFLYFTLSSLFVRLFFAKLSDKYGRELILIWSLSYLIFVLIYLSQVDEAIELMIAAGFMGMAVGMVSPTIFAWTIDLCSEHERGLGMATLYIALEIGIGTGALVSAWIYGNNHENVPYVFYISAFSVLIALIYLLIYHFKRNKINDAENIS